MTKKAWKKVSRLLKNCNRYSVYRYCVKLYFRNLLQKNVPIQNVIESATRTDVDSINQWIGTMLKYYNYNKET